MPIPLYHITEIGNLASIIECGGLWCDAERRRQKFAHVNIAHDHIKGRRERRRVPVVPGTTLADYVPFYFASRSPMLFAINRNNVEGYAGGQRRIVHLVTTVEAVVALGQGYCFTDRHAELIYAKFFTDLADIDENVDWNVMSRKYWSDSTDMRERRQAEFLARNCVPWSAVSEVGVMDAETQAAVSATLRQAGANTPVTVQRSWYY